MIRCGLMITMLALPAFGDQLTPAITHGAPVDRTGFRYARPIPQSGPGIARLRLDADVLARSHELADIRVVDAKNEQVPYLVEQMSDPVVVTLRVPRAQVRDQRSVYAVQLPYDTLPDQTRLVFTTTLHVFTRETALVKPVENQRIAYTTLSSARWQSTAPDLAPPPLTFEIPLRGTQVVELTVDEGDNAPLPITSARLLIPAAALRFYAPGTSLTLLYGNPEATAPRYDLALLPSPVFATPAQELTLGVPPESKPEAPLRGRAFFWVATAAVAVSLFALLARLLGGHGAARA